MRKLHPPPTCLCAPSLPFEIRHFALRCLSSTSLCSASTILRATLSSEGGRHRPVGSGHCTYCKPKYGRTCSRAVRTSSLPSVQASTKQSWQAPVVLLNLRPICTRQPVQHQRINGPRHSLCRPSSGLVKARLRSTSQHASYSIGRLRLRLRLRLLLSTAFYIEPARTHLTATVSQTSVHRISGDRQQRDLFHSLFSGPAHETDHSPPLPLHSPTAHSTTLLLLSYRYLQLHPSVRKTVYFAISYPKASVYLARFIPIYQPPRRKWSLKLKAGGKVIGTPPF